MPAVLLLGVALVVILAAVALTPLMLVQRYRVGTARRRARFWSSTVNIIGMTFSSALFVAGAAVASRWVPNALTQTIAAFAAGCLLGLIGLALSRWESAGGSLHYTPNRWLVLGLTLLVTARLAFGFWRSWQVWGATPDYAAWAAAGAAASPAAGAVVLGHYLTYWLGVRRRLRQLHSGKR